MELLYTLNTAKLNEGYNDPGDRGDDDDEEWPPFRKAGAYDPYSDDPRFSIQRIFLDPHTGVLVVGRTEWKPTATPVHCELCRWDCWANCRLGVDF